VLTVRVHPKILRSEDCRTCPTTRRRSGTTAIVRLRIWKDTSTRTRPASSRSFSTSPKKNSERFLARIDEKDKNWKFGKAGIAERGFWKQYMNTYEKCPSATSTRDGLWYVVPADDKENARLIVSRIVSIHSKTQNDLPESERTPPSRIAIDPQAVREVRF
jgi:hypothetical protein